MKKVMEINHVRIRPNCLMTGELFSAVRATLGRLNWFIATPVVDRSLRLIAEEMTANP